MEFEYFDRKGKKIDETKYNELRKVFEYKVLKQEVIKGYLISTVWLGANHNWSGEIPYIFETMVFIIFSDDIDSDDIELASYSTEEEALEGHQKMCDKYKNMGDAIEEKRKDK